MTSQIIHKHDLAKMQVVQEELLYYSCECIHLCQKDEEEGKVSGYKVWIALPLGLSINWNI